MKLKIVITFFACLIVPSVFGAGIEDLYPVIPSTVTPTTTSAPTEAPLTPSTTAQPLPTTTVPTTTAMPSTTSAPAPVQPGNWSYMDPVTHVRCLIVQATIQLSFNYTTKDNGTVSGVTLSVPTEAKTIEGNCNGMYQWIKVSSDVVNFTMNFTQEHGTFELFYMVFDVSTINYPNSSGSPVKIIYSNKTFITPMRMSYYCTRPQSLLALENGTQKVNVTMSHVHLEAFHTKNDYVFSATRDCDAHETPDIVPIAVGIALSSLVVVVLIAYVVARRRSPARGYTSM